MAHTSRGIWYPSTSDTVRPASRDFKDLALTTDEAIRQEELRTNSLIEDETIQPFYEVEVQQNAVDSLPVRWRHKYFNDPYQDQYTDTYSGSWVPSVMRGGEIPVLDSNGKIAEEQLPETFSYEDDLKPHLQILKQDLIVRAERDVSPDYPIFGARVAQAQTLQDPVAVVFAGSSTTARNPGYVRGLTEKLQTLYPVSDPTVPQWSTTADFTERTSPGLHSYSAGIGGTTAENYLSTDTCDKIAALNPALFIHMVGSNDYGWCHDPAVYKSRVQAWLDHLDTLLPQETQHVLVHAYQRNREPTCEPQPWELYGQALREIAEARSHNTRFIDVSPQYSANGVPGGDHLNLLSDQVHQTPAGNNFMTSLLAAHLTN